MAIQTPATGAVSIIYRYWFQFTRKAHLEENLIQSFGNQVFSNTGGLLSTSVNVIMVDGDVNDGLLHLYTAL